MEINIYNSNPIPVEKVLYELREGGTKMVIANSKNITQISWAPGNTVEVITVNRSSTEITDSFFKKFEEMETINWIREIYPTEQFYYGYLVD